MFQASGIWGLVDPMTGPELIDWAKFNNMQYRETPRVFSDFKVQRVDLEPLTNGTDNGIQDMRVGAYCSGRSNARGSVGMGQDTGGAKLDSNQQEAT